MLSTKLVGRNAASRKYDLLTALGTYALSRSKHDQRRVLRLMTLVTARYNWARDELAVGQREIARLWAVDERTVKREMARLRALGWLVVTRQGARGRVSEYSLAIETILKDTEADWHRVGPDFELRMGRDTVPEKVVAMPVRQKPEAPDLTGGSEWVLAQGVLHAEDDRLYASWFAALTRQGRAGGRLTLKAPSRFHGAYVQTHLEERVLRACQAVDADVTEIRIIC